jgi:hypothetical protein
MTTHDQQPDTFAWRAAPSHLKTRRQLRAMGLSPNAKPTALMVREATGRKRRRMWAHLFDTRLAAPKRTATPAQMEAVAKAVRGRQIRAAERRGISVEELLKTADPGPAWTGTHKEEGITVSDTFIDPDILDDQQPRLGEAAEPGQRLAQLHALMAVNRARYDRDQLRQYQAAAERSRRYLDTDPQDPDRQANAAGSAAAVDEWRQKLGERAARWQGTVPWHRSREVLPLVLADALIWREEDDKSREMADELIEHYRSGWGVVVDAETLTVSIDPEFDPGPVQRFDEAAAVWAREASALDMVSAAPLTASAKDAAQYALAEWTSSWNTEGGSHNYVQTQDTRREQLNRDLRSLLSDQDRPRIEFTVDYLRGDLAGVDLLDTPTLVDPGEEVRGRIPQLLESFANKRLSSKGMAAEISVMTATDQEKVREVGRAIVAGQTPDLNIWPGYVNRDQVHDQVRQYARDADEQLQVADWLAEADLSGESPEMIGVGDENEQRLIRMEEHRQHLDGVAHTVAPNGLISIERAQLAATLTDIDTGRRRGEQQLPALMWADDRSRANSDRDRREDTARRLSDATQRGIDEEIDRDGVVTAGTPAAKAVHEATGAIGDALYSVAAGPSIDGVEQQRKTYADRLQTLGTTLAKARVGRETKQRIRETVDHAARQAGQLGRAVTEREQRWKARTEQAVTTRDDAISQRQAAASGHARQPGRNCASRTGQAAQPNAPAPTRAAGRRQLHSDLGR